MESRNARLHQLMKQHNLSIADVAQITGRSMSTVRTWRSKYADREAPETVLRLLEAEVKNRSSGVS